MTLDPSLLPSLVWFARVVRHRSFTKAAAEFDVSRVAVSLQIKTLEEMRALIYGTHYNPETREELQWQPKLRGLNGPMYNGLKILESGEIVPVIRYEKPSKF